MRDGVRARPYGGGAPPSGSAFDNAASVVVEQANERAPTDLWLLSRPHGDRHVVVAAAGPRAVDHRPGAVVGWPAPAYPWAVPLDGFPAVRGPAWARSCAGVALVDGDGRAIGALCAFSSSRDVPDDPSLPLVAQLLTTIRSCEDEAVHRSEDAAVARRLAERDALTGLRNRRGWSVALEREDRRAARYRSSAAIVVIDLDGLKVVNDARGHAAGDALLRRAATAVDRVCRASDVVARVGGDEFCVLAVEADAGAVGALSERILQRLAAAGVEASLGSAVSTTGERLAVVWDRADRAMYVDKQDRARRRAALVRQHHAPLPAG